ncbi:MAG: diphthine--ammonia ligase [Candidatus Lokiarchaeota archaeon]|nr:diphthine--ammonia ligase [Candidatus Lokiarchaeota archaeon]
MSYAVSWSSGKDSGYACYEAMNMGLDITCLLNIISKDSGLVDSHRVSKELVQTQAKLMDIPLIQAETNWDDYTKNFKFLISNFPSKNIKGIIFGDIFVPEFQIQKHKLWAENICASAGLVAIEPLWNVRSKELPLKMLETGFEMIIVSIKKRLIGEEWLGRPFDSEFSCYIQNKGDIDPCGEKGEFHTVVLNCPMFKKKIKVLKTNKTENEKYCFLNITKWTT